jgi:hypothetical protein
LRRSSRQDEPEQQTAAPIIERVIGDDQAGVQYDTTRASMLFENYLNPAYAREVDLREYIQGKLVKLAEDDALYLTDILNHPDSRVVMVAGMIMMGQSYKDWSAPIKEQIVNEGLIPREIRDYKIKIKAIGDNRIQWKDGNAQAGWCDPKTRRHPRMAPVWNKVDPAVRELDMEPKDAIKLLKQCGKFVARYKNRSTQAKHWKVHEVKPPGLRG